MRGGSSATEEEEVDLGLSCSQCSVLQPEARERVLQCVLYRLWEKNKKLKDERVMEGRGWWAEWTVDAPRPSEAGRLTE